MKLTRFFKGRSLFTVSTAIYAVASLILFQNCSQVGFIADDLNFLKSSNNGGGYGGKPDGDFYRFVPGFMCEEAESYLMHIAISTTSIDLTENKRLACGAVKQQLAPEAIDTSIYQGDIVGYQEGIFEGATQLPMKIPSNLVEVWCRDDHTYNGIETMTHYDRTTSLALNRIYYATPNSDGSYQRKKISDFPVGRVLDDKTVIVKDGQGFELIVHRDQPAAEAGLFVAHMDAVIDGAKVSRDTSCRLGGSLDADIWPAQRIVDTNVLQMKTSPDRAAFAYTSDTGTGSPDRSFLAVSKVIGTAQKKISSSLAKLFSSFAFTPDSRRLTYVNSFDAAPSITAVNLDGTAAIEFDKVEPRTAFTYSSDGNFLIYNKYDRSYQLPGVGLKSVSLQGGPIATLNPPLELGAMNVAGFIAHARKIVFTCCNGPSTQIYVVNPDGSGLKALPRTLPAGWDYTTQLNAPGEGNLLSIWAWNIKSSPLETANYAVALDGSGSVKLPSGWLWTGTSPRQDTILLRKESDLTTAVLMNLASGKKTALPAFEAELIAPPRSGIEMSDSRFFTGDSLSYVMLRSGAVAGSRSAVAVSVADGSVTELCPGVNATFVKELSSGTYLIAGVDASAGLLGVYKKPAAGTCLRLNLVPTKIATFKQVRIAVADDESALLATTDGTNMKGESVTQLFYIPLNGQASYQVNTPVVATAGIRNAFFNKNSKSVLFVGDQIRIGENGVFKWSPP